MRYLAAEWRPSPNRNNRSGGVNLIVIHHTDGQPNAERAVTRLCSLDAKVSAHFVVGRAGEVYQLVDTDEVAWHDKGRNGESIGIEHVARTPNEFKNWLDLSGKTRVALGGEADSAMDPGLTLTDTQLAASAKLVAWLLREHKLPIAAVTPHCSSPSTTHSDCGLDVERGGIWPWTRYLEMIADAQKELASSS